jgi:hypothetical protein
MFAFKFFKNFLSLGFKLTQLWLGMSWGKGLVILFTLVYGLIL